MQGGTADQREGSEGIEYARRCFNFADFNVAPGTLEEIQKTNDGPLVVAISIGRPVQPRVRLD